MKAQVERAMYSTMINHIDTIMVFTEGLTDVNGELVLDIFYQDVYQLSAGKWGSITTCFSDTLITSSTGVIEVYLEAGLYDDFTFDFGWDTIHTGSKEGWVREIPVGVIKNGTISNPFSEIGWDCGKYAYITGNGSEVSNAEEINDGEAVLFSPLMDLTTYSNPHINYAIWYFNQFGAVPDDTLFIYMDNGLERVLVDYFDPETTIMGQWLGNSVSLFDKIVLTANMQLEVYISDYITSENITEAAFDYFSVTDYSVLSNEDQVKVEDEVNVYPNPFNDKLMLSKGNLNVKIYNFSGQLMLESNNEIEINTAKLQSGIYLIHISNTHGENVLVEKLIKL